MADDQVLNAPWLESSDIRVVFDAFDKHGLEIRVVGGAVRNTLLGRAVADIDLATVALPEQTIEIAKASGLRVVPTGLKHGTVTVLSGDKSFEVTTLRHDTETDGRHAVVKYTDDWAADAARRDFTINALYCAPDGRVFDPLGGMADVQTRTVRFIGDADERIREDYLRILRFFRFTAEYCFGAPEAVGLAACSRERDGLLSLSAERVRGELLRILVAPRAIEIVEVMFDHGFLASLLGLVAVPRHMQRYVALEAALGAPADPVAHLGCLAVFTTEDKSRLSRRLKVSNDERRILADSCSWRDISNKTSECDLRRQMYFHGADRIRRRLLTAWARSGSDADDAKWLGLWHEATMWVVPHLPIHGQDVIDAGVPSGERIGKILKAVETWWVERDFKPDRTAALEYLASLTATDLRLN